MELPLYAKKNLESGGEILFFVEPDKLKGFIEIKTGESLPLFDEVLETVGTVFAKDLIDVDVMRDAVHHLKINDTCHRRRVVKGKVPDDGGSGKLLLLAKPIGKTPQEQSDKEGSIFDLGLFDNIEPGRIVARIYPAKEGEDGRDVFGKTIKAQKGAPLKITYDDSVVKEPANGYETLISKVFGYLEHKGSDVKVHDTLVIKGNIDMEVGNLGFVGKIEVQGDVGTGFFVKGERGVTIKGSVAKDAKVTSPLGEILIKGYVSKAALISPKVTVTVLNDAYVEADQITIVKESIGSHLIAKEGIDGKTATIFGGEAVTVLGLAAKVLGHGAGTDTKIVLTSPTHLNAKYVETVTAIAKHTDIIALLISHLGPLATDTKKRALLPLSHREKIEASLKKLKEVEKSKGILVENLAQFDAENPMVEAKPPLVSCEGWIRPGVVFMHGDRELRISVEKKGPISFTDDGELKEIPYQQFSLPSQPGEEKNGKK